MPEIPELNFRNFSDKYCERQENDYFQLLETLGKQNETYAPDGWVMLECQMMDSGRMGSLTILPFGPNNTYKTVPDHPVSPRGLASDMSVVVAIVKRDSLLEAIKLAEQHRLQPK